MALETLKGIDKIGGFKVKRVNWNQPDSNFIEINDEGNAITFKIQKGPIGEVGSNGCQVDTMIATSAFIIAKLNEKFPCRENEIAITKLQEAMMWLEQRRVDREARGVEGLSKK